MVQVLTVVYYLNTIKISKDSVGTKTVLSRQDQPARDIF